MYEPNSRMISALQSPFVAIFVIQPRLSPEASISFVLESKKTLKGQVCVKTPAKGSQLETTEQS